MFQHMNILCVKGRVEYGTVYSKVQTTIFNFPSPIYLILTVVTFPTVKKLLKTRCSEMNVSLNTQKT